VHRAPWLFCHVEKAKKSRFLSASILLDYLGMRESSRLCGLDAARLHESLEHAHLGASRVRLATSAFRGVIFL